MQLGHRGQPCPSHLGKEWENMEGRKDCEDVDLLEADNINSNKEEKIIMEKDIFWDDIETTIVHTTGIFQQCIRWCQCPDAPSKDIQHLQMQQFPNSFQQPKTVLTFDVLDYFYIDAMECKTTASSFIKKTCRLTNNAFPHTVPVSSQYLTAFTY